jgi:hypothetical protein
LTEDEKAELEAAANETEEEETDDLELAEEAAPAVGETVAEPAAETPPSEATAETATEESTEATAS